MVCMNGANKFEINLGIFEVSFYYSYNLNEKYERTFFFADPKHWRVFYWYLIYDNENYNSHYIKIAFKLKYG